MKKRFDYWQKLEAEKIYHVYNRSIGEANLYETNENYRFFLQKWQKYLGAYLDVLAYCLMPNHFHFMVKVKQVDSTLLEKIKRENTVAAKKFLRQEAELTVFLEDQFRRAFSSYSLAFNKQEGRTGSLMQKRFKRVSINQLEKVVDKLFYIHHNPIHHGYTNHYDEWRFSSYDAYFSSKPTKVCKAEMFDIFRSVQLEEVEDEVSALRKAHERYRQDRRNDLFDLDDF